MKLVIALASVMFSVSAYADRPSEIDLAQLANQNEVLVIVDASEDGVRNSSQTLEMYVDGGLSLRVDVSTGIRNSTTAGEFDNFQLFQSRYTAKYHTTMLNTVAFEWIYDSKHNDIRVISAIYASKNRKERFGRQDTQGSVRVPKAAAEKVFQAVGSSSKAKIVIHY